MIRNLHAKILHLLNLDLRAKYSRFAHDGHEAISGRIHTHDLHATMLHLLGLDHEQLTYRYAGRDFRLTTFMAES